MRPLYIDKLNGNDELSIEQDENGYDEHFGIPKTDFGKGMVGNSSYELPE